MTELLLLKVALIADIVSIVAFVADYTRLVPWWKNPVGRTFVVKDFFLLFVVSLTTLSVFFRFSRLTSQVAGWLQVAGLGAMAAAMLWRIVVFERIDRRAHRPPGEHSDAKEPDDRPGT